jgi:deoxynucleoside triphosphate triphosphohydrolase SAMHD1
MYLANELFGIPSKLIMDPVHGGIPLFEHERKMIDHPLFQRLRSISQNDILFFVFPGATHTRFLHSIGTMHVAGRIFREIIQFYLIELDKNTLINEQRHAIQYFEICDKNKLILANEQRHAIQYFEICLRLAALLHDTGHGPFSHQFETVSSVKDILSSKNFFQDLWEDQNYKEYYNECPRQIHHEHYSVRCAYKILNDVLANRNLVEVKDVLGIMETTTSLPSDKFIQHAKSIWKIFANGHSKDVTDQKIGQLFQGLLSSIVSGELDADKMDYLLRDSYFTGCKYGVYSLDHLISNIRVGFAPESPWLGLAINQKGLGAFEDFVYSRFQLYKQVYNHKAVIGFKWLLERAIVEILNDNKNVDTMKECLSNIEDFEFLTDTFFWEKFREMAKKDSESDSYKLIKRIKLVHLDEQENVDEVTIALRKTEIAESRKIEPKKVINCDGEARFSKIKSRYKDMKVLVKDPISGKKRLIGITKASSFFDKFQDIIVTHFYKEPF